MNDPQPLEAKLEYAKDVLASVQELIRFMDQKSGFIVGICIFFVSSLFSVLQGYTGKPAGIEAYLVFALALWYLGHTAASIWHAIMTSALRHTRLQTSSTAPGLGFPLRIIEKYHSSSAAYIDALKRAGTEDLLADVAEQVVSVSVVYATKAHHLGLAVTHLQWSAIPWFAAVVMAVIGLGLPQFEARSLLLLAIGIFLVLAGLLVLRSYRSASPTPQR